MTEGKRRTSLLNEVLEHRMALYALAAGAALAAVPAVTQAKVVFTAKDVITRYTSRPYNIDLNHDGVVDLYLELGGSICSSYARSCAWDVGANPVGSFTAFVGSSPTANPAALQRGAAIGGSDAFTRVTLLAATGLASNAPPSSSGNFEGQTNRFLGIRFMINGETHYGWVGFRRISGYGAKVVGWAYETVPNKPILAGDRGYDEDSRDWGVANPMANRLTECSSMELLAMGHTAIAERQRRMETTVAG